jgi:MbtH protein
VSEPQVRRHVVVVNDEDQYSIWPAGQQAPPGWTTIGQPASRNECLEHIAELWVDMRPKSLRQRGRAGSDTA